MIKKIIVNEFNADKSLAFKNTFTTRRGIHANDYAQAKKLIAKKIQHVMVGKQNFTVEWTREGRPEGYIVNG